MKQLHFDYYMQLDYDQVVTLCHFTIKCLPQDTLRQHILNTEIRLQPDVPYSQGRDGFKNLQIYGRDDVPHRTFSLHMTGDAETCEAACETEEDESLSPVFSVPHGLNLPGEQIRAFYHELLKEREGREDLQFAELLMHRLYGEMAYVPGSTDMKTGAEEAFSQRKGVCQDYAHIFTALMHLAGIPARYVTGLLTGEGASHAWVEILQDHFWYGFDPTNDTRVSDSYIRIGTGRDAADCLINRGIMHGGGTQKQTIRAAVTEME